MSNEKGTTRVLQNSKEKEIPNKADSTEFVFGDMKLYLTQSPNGNRYVTVFIGTERRFYELDHFMSLYEKFHVFIVQKTKVKVSENGNS